MKLSILMPVKNESFYIEESIKSIQSIDFIDFEVVLVDDGSSDNTVKRIQKLNMPFVKLIQTKGIGKVKAYNLAYENSVGDFFILLGGDDLLISSAIKVRIAPLVESKNLPAVSFCKLLSFSKNKRYDNILMPKRKDRGLETGGCIAFNKSFAELTFPIPDFLINEDSWITLHSRYLCSKISHVPVIGLMYRIHENNSFRRGIDFLKFNEQLWARQLAVFYFYEKYKEKLSIEQNRELLSEFCLYILRYLGYSSSLLLIPLSSFRLRVKIFFNSCPKLFAIRDHFYNFFSGR